MLRTILLAFALVATVTASARGDHHNDATDSPQIKVDGLAFLDAKPDEAILSLGVVSEKPTAREAAADIAASTAAVLAIVKSFGVEPKDIRTESINLDPVIVEERDPMTKLVTKRTLTGYHAADSIMVVLRDVDKAPALAGRVIESGANVFDGLNFQISDYTARLDQLRAKAVGDSMRRAALYAQGAHMKLGRLIAIDPNPDSGAAADLPTRKLNPGPQRIVIPVEPGVLRIEATVSATWELVPE